MIDTIAPEVKDYFPKTKQSIKWMAIEALMDVPEINQQFNFHAFTWNPDPAKYPSGKPEDQYRCLLDHCLLAAFKCFSYFCFVPELTKSGNTHIHGWYIIKDNISYHKWFLPQCKRLGFVLVKAQSNKQKVIPEEWQNYLLKEMEDNVIIYGEKMPIPLTHNNYQQFKKLWRQHNGLKFKPVKMIAIPTLIHQYKKTNVIDFLKSQNII